MNSLGVEFVRCRHFLVSHYNTLFNRHLLPFSASEADLYRPFSYPASVASFLAIPCPTPVPTVVLSRSRPTPLNGNAVIFSAFAPAPLAPATLVASAAVFVASL